jgi:hypothetical protein
MNKQFYVKYSILLFYLIFKSFLRKFCSLFQIV